MGEDIGEHAAGRAAQINHRGSDIEYIFDDGSMLKMDVNGEVTPYGKSTNALYKLDLPDEDIAKMLDWDAPLSEQPKAIQDALLSQRTNSGDLGLFRRIRSDLEARGKQHNDLSLTGGEFFEILRGMHSEKEVSKIFQDVGIPGVKYYDQMSRSPVDTQLKINTTESQIADFKRMLVDDNSGLVTSENKVVVREALKQAEAELGKLKYELDNPKKRTRNYVTWDQDVLDRTKILEGGGMGLLK